MPEWILFGLWAIGSLIAVAVILGLAGALGFVGGKRLEDEAYAIPRER